MCVVWLWCEGSAVQIETGSTSDLGPTDLRWRQHPHEDPVQYCGSDWKRGLEMTPPPLFETGWEARRGWLKSQEG